MKDDWADAIGLWQAGLIKVRDVMLSVERDSAVRVVVLRGAGKGFMAGGDVQLFHAQLDQNLDRQMLDMTLAMHDAVISMHRMPKPVLAKTIITRPR